MHFSESSLHICVCPPSLPQRWAVISKTQMKNAKKAFNREQMKCDAKDKKEVCVYHLLHINSCASCNLCVRTMKKQMVSLTVCSVSVVQAEDNERREKNLEEAKKIVIENDPSLPEPETVSSLYYYTSLTTMLHLVYLNCTKSCCLSLIFNRQL